MHFVAFLEGERHIIFTGGKMSFRFIFIILGIMVAGVLECWQPKKLMGGNKGRNKRL